MTVPLAQVTHIVESHRTYVGQCLYIPLRYNPKSKPYEALPNQRSYFPVQVAPRVITVETRFLQQL